MNTQDPWKHRSEGMCCKTCMWFCPKKTDVTKERGMGEGVQVTVADSIGRCRKHSPTMNGYPVVFENDWCGDHKLDENKVITND